MRSKPVRAALLLALLAGCAGPRILRPPETSDPRVPPFARVPFQPITREAVVSIALREWRLFGAPVDDDPPGSRPPAAVKPEREPGLWQRVGEYWWLGVDKDSKEAAWTGRTDGQGVIFPPDEDGDYAWSAAFIGYVMRIAGAGPRFPYSEAHSTYIDIAKEQKTGRASGWLLTAERPSEFCAGPRRPDLLGARLGPRSHL